MKISGFTMVKNATKLYYPIRQSIESILPVVDEFIVALGDCDPDDHTEAEILHIGSEKIRIVKTVWDLEKYPNGTENAHQTDLAKSHCTGDWLFYLQADEVVHEQYLPRIRRCCEAHLHDPEVEGMLFGYVHFWGDYWHHQVAHGWYKNEIRIIRNLPDFHSWESAQSFRRLPGFDGRNYRQQAGTFKLKVAAVPAFIYHYGWVRPPQLMQRKKKSLDTIHKGVERVAELYRHGPAECDYGPLGRAAKFTGTHPAVMKAWMEKFDWQGQLNYSRRELNPHRERHKHDSFRVRLLTFLEQKLLGGREIGGFRNYVLLRGKLYR
ncbi:MAG: hypothetical protein HY842_01765 [Bacteroidetes bacterium]|nr:hypothetical protein [Bacteroidota bacterium]